MAKKILPLIFFLSFFFSKSYSQDFLGLSTGNYTGISGVMLQPASIVDSRYKFDINLFSTGVNYGNNYFLLDRDVILKFNKNKFDDYPTFKDRYLSEATLMPREKVFFNINNRTQIPLSFMATTGKKSAIALNMQFRTMIQGRGISQDFAELAFNDFYHGPLTNTSVDVSGISINSLSWAEVGFTYGRVLFSSDKHFLKGAITGKYLAGLSSVNISSNDLRMSVNNDSTFNFNTSNVSYNHNKNADFDKIFDKNFSPDANAFGLDAGLVYEYRGNIDKFKYIKTDDEKSYDALRRDVNKYIFKLGVSLVDVGMFNFNKPANVNSFQGNINNWDIRNAHYKTLKNFDTALANRVLPNLNDSRNYNVYLPTALSAQFDVKFVKGLFLNVMSYWPISLGDEPGKRFDKFGYYSITPRFETRHFGLYIPYTVTQRNDLADYKQHLLGATVRIGPLFIGSSNLGSMLFNKELKSADVHVGLKVGFTYGKPNKSNKILRTVFRDEEPVETSAAYELEEARLSKAEIAKEKKGTTKKVDKEKGESTLMLDYKAGKVYDNPEVKQNITVINNYYYGSAPADRPIDPITVQRSVPVYNADSLRFEMQKIVDQRNKVIADSIKKVTSDSLKIKRQQLDSLIKSMQQLQQEMDSTIRDQANVKSDSTNAYNNVAMSRLQRDLDSLKSQQDSLQAIRGEALMTRTTAYRQDSVRADLERQKDIASSDKKKAKSLTDSIKADNNLRSIDSSLAALSDSFALQMNQDTRKQQQLVRLQDSLSKLSQQYADLSDNLTEARKNSQVPDSSAKKVAKLSVKQKDLNLKKQQDLERMQDSLGKMVKRYSNLADSLSNATIEAQRNSDEAVLIPEQRNAIATARTPERRNEMDSREFQRLQDKQDELYRQYARQADVLSKDIDRLNKRVISDRRNDRRDNRGNNNYIPIPIPINNSGNANRQAPVQIAAPVAPDTVYIRDSVVLRDSIRIIDTVSNWSPDKFVSRPIQEIPKPDTVTVTEFVEQPGFDFEAMPEENVLFALGQRTIQPIYESKLDYIAGILRKNSDLQVRVTGHTDSSGSKAVNERLSLQRAEAVANYLLDRGVSRQQINTKSQTFENPAVSGNTKAARSQNRRVALKLEKL